MSISEGERSTVGQGAIPADTFASRLMLVRVHAGYLTIKEAAEKCGLNYGSWSNWERGSRPQDKDEVVEAISRSLGIDRDWLMWGGSLAAPEPARVRMARRLSRPTAEYGAIVKRTRPRGMRTPLSVLVDHSGIRPVEPEPAKLSVPGITTPTCGSPSITRPSILPRRTNV